MFSGLISQRGTVAGIVAHPGGGARLTVVAPDAIAEGVAHGDSIAINGVCLTVVAFDHETLAFDVVPETLLRSTLGQLRPGDVVNLELSLRMGDRLGGHLVYAHVDTTVEVLERREDGLGSIVRFSLPERYAPYILEKGYVCLDGVSLTVAYAAEGEFSIAMIPETAVATTLGTRRAGDRVNFELDPFARYAIEGALRYTAATRAA